MGNDSPSLWSTEKLPQGVMVLSPTSAPVAGIGHNYFRPWLYPLYSPSGRQVLQEYPFDHPFHNGLFIGWQPIKHRGRDHNFWATPPQRSDPDPMMANLGQVRTLESRVIQSSEKSIQLAQDLEWMDFEGNKLLQESRAFTLWQPSKLSHAVRMQSTLTCLSTDPIIFESTKFAYIGVRLDPVLTPALGGYFANGSGEIGSAKLFHGNRFESLTVRSRKNDLELKINPKGFTAPWFVRDYGLVLLNPTSTFSQTLEFGQSMCHSIELIASDI